MVNREKSKHMPGMVKPETSKLTAITFDPFLDRAMKAAQVHEHIVLDLTDVQFMDLFAMVGIIYCCEAIREQHGCRIRLAFTEEGAGGFFPRIGFFNVLGSAIEYPEVFTPARLEWERALQGADVALLELTPIELPTVIKGVMDKLIHVLHYQLRYPKNAAFDLAIIFSELCNNILDHNPIHGHGLAAMQVFGSHATRFMQFVVADRGASIKTTLQHNTAYASLQSDTEAILTSTQLGVSEHHEQMRGNGLYHLLEFAFKHGGSVLIRSGTGKVYWKRGHFQPYQFSVPYLQGAQFSITFPTRMGRNA